ncbi:MAG: tRNA (adenosine(37)-N6)-threonylcarbamoyltransferase complex ATPase subunit type 1 TsaE [Dehalococcoidia bacterium]|nr:tRNA (adenosine(37)-N6)-threonylcarbamoyltransferase complex ATPase subunit type 1 TsaE [Dehalococcoidia bacterium]
MAVQDTLDFISHSARQTGRFGARLGRLLAPGDLILLDGPVGAGKTIMAQGIAKGLEISEPVVSPSFTIVREYAGRLPLYHIDLYRLAPGSALESIGIEDFLYSDGAVVIEWPDRASALLPAEQLQVSLKVIATTKRGVRMMPASGRASELVAQFRRNAFGV